VSKTIATTPEGEWHQIGCHMLKKPDRFYPQGNSIYALDVGGEATSESPEER
jgi:hypothetical protein